MPLPEWDHGIPRSTDPSQKRRYAVGIGIALITLGLLVAGPPLFFRTFVPQANFCIGRAPQGYEYGMQSRWTGEMRLWPLGTRCTFETADGQVLVVEEDNWYATVTGYGGLAVAAGGVVLVTTKRPHERSG